MLLAAITTRPRPASPSRPGAGSRARSVDLLHPDQCPGHGSQDHQLRRRNHRPSACRGATASWPTWCRASTGWRIIPAPIKAAAMAPSSAASPTASRTTAFKLDGVTYHISRDPYRKETDNEPYDERVWTARTKDGDEPQLILSLLDRDGTMGFPGTVRVTGDLYPDPEQCVAHRLSRQAATRTRSSVSPIMPISTWPAMRRVRCWISC